MNPANPKSPESESGVALMYALLVTLVVGGVVAVTFATALSEQRLATAELQFEDTVHVAEAGAEKALQRVAESSDHSNAPALACSTTPGGCTDDEQREWAETQARGVSEAALTRLSEGETIGLRPEGSDYVYGVGFVPSREAVIANDPRSYTRVVRMQVVFDEPRVLGEYTFLADSIVDVAGGGSSTIIGGVKSNNGVKPAGINWNVDKLELVGDCLTNDGAPQACPGSYEQVPDTTPILFGTALQLYRYDSADVVINTPWYDYCGAVDRWREREGAASEPCTGPKVATVPGFGSGTVLGGEGRGVYYFHGGENVDLTLRDRGNLTHNMTLITTGKVTLPSGSTFMNWTPAYPGLLVYAGKVDGFTGSPSITAPPTAPGIIYAIDSISISGTASSTDVSWIAGGSFALNGGGSGTFRLTGKPAVVDPGLPPQELVVAWDEL